MRSEQSGMNLTLRISEGELISEVSGVPKDLVGKEVHFRTHLGVGSLSDRYFVEIDKVPYFMKTYRHGDSCSGSASHEINKNEIAIQTELRKYGGDKINMLYRGNAMIEDTVVLLFQDMRSVGEGGRSLDDLFVVRETASQDTTDLIVRKQGVQAKNYPCDLGETVSLLIQAAQQAERYHTLCKDHEASYQGLVHMDINPENVVRIDTTGKDEKGEYLVHEAHLIDPGIARFVDQSTESLFNKETAKGVSGGTGGYYNATKGLFPTLYCPPHASRDYAKARPSFDTYNLSNLLCLMVTGRLVEHYWKEAVPHEDSEAPGETFSSDAASQVKSLNLVEIRSDKQFDAASSRGNVKAHGNVRVDLGLFSDNLKPYLNEKCPTLDETKKETLKSIITEVVLQGTSLDPSQRFQTAAELVAALEKLAARLNLFGISPSKQYLPEAHLQTVMPDSIKEKHQKLAAEFAATMRPDFRDYRPLSVEMYKTLADLDKQGKGIVVSAPEPGNLEKMIDEQKLNNALEDKKRIQRRRTAVIASATAAGAGLAAYLALLYRVFYR